MGELAEDLGPPSSASASPVGRDADRPPRRRRTPGLAPMSPAWSAEAQLRPGRQAVHISRRAAATNRLAPSEPSPMPKVRMRAAWARRRAQPVAMRAVIRDDRGALGPSPGNLALASACRRRGEIVAWPGAIVGRWRVRADERPKRRRAGWFMPTRTRRNGRCAAFAPGSTARDMGVVALDGDGADGGTRVERGEQGLRGPGLADEP